MPITITPSSPTNDIGPGLLFKIHTDITAFPFPAFLNIETFTSAAPTLQGWSEAFTQVGNDEFFRLGTHQNVNTISGPANIDIPDDTSVEFHAILTSTDFSTSDFGQITVPWNTRDGVTILQALQLAQSSTSGGLTPTQAAQLESAATDSAAALAGVQTTINQGGTAIATTLGQLFGGFTLDSLAVVDLSGGVTCDPINVTLVGAPFGVIIEATTVPDFYPFTAPGDQWTPLDLAVVQFVRGTDVLKRFGMHTRKHMEYPLPGVLLGLGTLIDLPLLPPDYHLEVWWGNGVCGQVFGLQTP